MFSANLCKIIFGLMLMLLSSAAFSFSLSDYNGRCGNTRVILGPTYGKHAVANVFSNTITIDPITARSASPMAMEFIFFHECGHITYLHVPAAYSSVRQKYEDDADCYAARRFRGTYGQAALTKVLQELEPVNGKSRNHNIQTCE